MLEIEDEEETALDRARWKDIIENVKALFRYIR